MLRIVGSLLDGRSRWLKSILYGTYTSVTREFKDMGNSGTTLHGCLREEAAMPWREMKPMERVLSIADCLREAGDFSQLWRMMASAARPATHGLTVTDAKGRRAWRNPAAGAEETPGAAGSPRPRSIAPLKDDDLHHSQAHGRDAPQRRRRRVPPQPGRLTQAHNGLSPASTASLIKGPGEIIAW